MMHKYIYYDRSLGFGIVITMNANVIVSPVIYESDILVVNQIYLRIKKGVMIKKDQINRYLCKAIQDLEVGILNTINDRVVCISVDSFEFDLAHFQEEGFYLVMKEWLCLHYGIPIEPVSISYDYANRKFLFEPPM